MNTCISAWYVQITIYIKCCYSSLCSVIILQVLQPWLQHQPSRNFKSALHLPCPAYYTKPVLLHQMGPLRHLENSPARGIPQWSVRETDGSYLWGGHLPWGQGPLHTGPLYRWEGPVSSSGLPSTGVEDASQIKGDGAHWYACVI